MVNSASVVLTKRLIEAAKPAARRYEIWDSDVAGFGIRIGLSGSKTFVVRYRAEGGGREAPRRYVTVGRFGALTVEQGRKKAKELLAEATVGKDPAAERKAKRLEMKMSALVDLYDAEGCYIQRGKRLGQPMKPRSKQFLIARLRHHVVPLLGHMKVTEVKVGHIERFFADVKNGKSARDVKLGHRRRIIVRGGEGAARKVFRDLSAMFSFAERRGIIPANLCHKAVVQKTDGANDRYLTLKELEQLGAACDALEAEGTNVKALNITRLWVLTGCRRDEIAGLKWQEVDFERGVLALEDSKTGKSVRPLATAAITLLHSIKCEGGSGYVFPAASGDNYYQGTKGIWPRIVKRAGLEGVTPHTLRHTMGAMSTSSGEALALTGAILGHANLRSTMRYAHVQLDPSLKAANRVGTMLAAALAGSKPHETEVSNDAQA
ncbi:site-specific integrase [Sphingomonas sp. AR_OL41]|uniref:tyrosine-type recombinase/integrase n=1 Tax=Sphingomonas sp. AR_OL41 TaxID=3042729 RepID=UPI00248183C7|nr:site-specific integrase [Sphingomonas sp. AR_OL41]MDH7973003.1 site-specific integrase [Sphingomonas sp. AR_OL41]